MKAALPTLLAGAIAAAVACCMGCGPVRDAAKTAGASSDELLMASVVDEADAIAWSGQVELAALGALFGRIPPGTAVPPGDGPGRAELLAQPSAYRGEPVRLTGKLLSVDRVTFTEEGAVLGPLFRGVVMTGPGEFTAFMARAERPPLMEAVGADQRIAVVLPEVGSPVAVAGLFLKRWVALDAAGGDYVTMPMLAAGEVAPAPEADAQRLAPLAAPAGLLPLKLLDVPEVWNRPVVELDARGRLKLDGSPVSWKELENRIWPQAARYRNPLGDSALAMVAIIAPGAPADDARRLCGLPATVGARCIVRAAPAAAE